MPTSEQIAAAYVAIHDAECSCEYPGEHAEATVEHRRKLARATTRAAEALDPIEWGVEYEATPTESVYTAAHSEKQARKWVAQSPTDTGLRKRRAPGPWIALEGETDHG